MSREIKISYPPLAVGQIWEDMDKRMKVQVDGVWVGRRVVIASFDDGFVTVVNWHTGRTTQISTARMRSVAGGYRLVGVAPAQEGTSNGTT